MADAKLTWSKVDPSSLPEALRAKWQALKTASEQQRVAREAFETAFIAASVKAKKVGGSQTIAFGYRFGGLAVAVVEKTAETPKATGTSWF